MTERGLTALSVAIITNCSAPALSEAPATGLVPQRVFSRAAAGGAPLGRAWGAARRPEFLAGIGITPYEAVPAEVDETVRRAEKPAGLARRLAAAKAAFVAERLPGAWVLGAPRCGHLQARFPAAGSEVEVSAHVESAFGAVTELAQRVCGEFVLEAGPINAKAGRDVFGDLGGRQALHRALKAQFDPDSVLNPGRMAGRI